MPSQSSSSHTVGKKSSKPTRRTPQARAYSATQAAPTRRSPAGTTLLNERDVFALVWIGEQYGIRLDHLQWLLGCFPGRGARYRNWISEGAARDVVARWKRAGWVRAVQIRVHEPLWVWLTRVGLRKVGLRYKYRDLEQSGLDDLKHLYAINEIRLSMRNEEAVGQQWISERHLLQGVVRVKGKALLHRPDAHLVRPDGSVIAVEAELSLKKPFELEENLLELFCGEDYLQLKAEYGAHTARTMNWGYQSQYQEIWYYAPARVRKQVYRARAHLISQGALRPQDARALYVAWYPLPRTADDMAQQERENEAAFDLNQSEAGQGNEQEHRPEAEPEGRDS